MTFREYPLQQVIEHLAVGLVVTLAFFVLHHAALLVEFLLADGPQQVTHPVRLHPQGHVERGFRHVLEIVGAVEVGRAVHVGGADAFERLEVFVVEVLSAVEHQVFEQVGEAGLAGFLVLRADVVPDVDGNDRRLVVFMHDQPQPVGQRVFGVRNLDVGGERGRPEHE